MMRSNDWFNVRTVFVTCTLMLMTIGCGVTQKVTFVKAPTRAFATAAMVPQAGNSSEMDAHVRECLIAQKINVLPSLPAGTRKSEEADLIVSYGDAWYWDMTMYLRLLTIDILEGNTGELLATGHFDNNSAFHSYPDADRVVRELMVEMFTKLRPAATATPVDKPDIAPTLN